MSDLTEVPDLMGKLDAAMAVVRAEERERVLADAKARIEGLAYVRQMGNYDAGYNVAIADALAALTRPQTGIEGKPDGTWYDIPDGGGSGQSPSGVADADLEARIEALAKDWETWDGMRHERYISELRALIEPEPYVPTPYAKAFRERVCPVPDFPGIEKEES